MIVRYSDEDDRFFPGDRIPRRVFRKLIRPAPVHLSGMRRVVRNFLTGLERKQIKHWFNPPPLFASKKEKVISFGLGRMGLRGVSPDAPLIAAVGFPYPTEFPDLCDRYNVKLFLQHSRWALDLIRSANIYDETILDLWPAGIDTQEWQPAEGREPPIDVLIYYKIHWQREEWDQRLLLPIMELISSRGLQCQRIDYGRYSPAEYKQALHSARAAIFLSPHESQGFAYQECLACDVPVLAWDPGRWLDPARHVYGRSCVPATSVPFFDERCGRTFSELAFFEETFEQFWSDVQQKFYRPREFILDNLTIERSADRMIQLYESI